MLSKRAAAFTTFLKWLRYRGNHDTTSSIEQRTARSRRVTSLLTVPQPLGTRTIKATIPGARAVWHVGKEIRDDVRIVYCHGGGYVAGSPTTHRHFTSAIAKATGIPVLSVDYRLAPEHPYPAALEDALTAYRWAAKNGPMGRGDVSRIIMGGDSAGGGLTFAAAMRLRDEGELLPGAIFTLSPWMDLTMTAESIERLRAVDVMVTPEAGGPWALAYRGDYEATVPGISPLLADFEGLPPLYFSVGGREILLDDTLSAIEKAKAAGVPTELDRHEQMFHVWPLFYHLLPEGRASLNGIIDFVKRHSAA